MKRTLGVDPGSVSGAIAMITDDQVYLADMPTMSKNINPAELTRTLREWRPDVAVIEQVGAFPGQGSSSIFQFGRGYGTAIGILAALEIPLHFVVPGVWKRFYKLPGKKEAPDAGRVKAIELYPWVRGLELKKHGNRADALLLAHWLHSTTTK